MTTFKISDLPERLTGLERSLYSGLRFNTAKDIESKQQGKIYIEHSPEMSDTGFQVLPHPELHQIHFLFSIKP